MERPMVEEDIVAGAGEDNDRESATAATARMGVSWDPLLSWRSSRTGDDEGSDEDDDDVTSPPEGGRKSPDGMQLDGGPLYELSALLAHLPVRTGLSKFYKGRSQSFSSLSDAKCMQDLEKKIIPYNIGPRSKGVTKKTPRGSSGSLLSNARSKPSAHQRKEDVHKF